MGWVESVWRLALLLFDEAMSLADDGVVLRGDQVFWRMNAIVGAAESMIVGRERKSANQETTLTAGRSSNSAAGDLYGKSILYTRLIHSVVVALTRILPFVVRHWSD